MREVIQKLVDAEAEARRMIEAARTEAATIVSDARRAAEEGAAQSRVDTRAEAEKAVQSAVLEARQEAQQRLARAAADIESEVRVDPAVQQRLVDAAVRCVCGLP